MTGTPSGTLARLCTTTLAAAPADPAPTPRLGSRVVAREGRALLDHRTGAVITQPWAGVARYVLERGTTHLASCASVPLRDGGAAATGVWALVRDRHLAPAAQRVVPPVPCAGAAPVPADPLVVPPLLGGAR